MGAALLALASSLGAQAEAKAFARVDPYTKNSPEALEKAGYVSFGPFRFGDDHTTAQVDSALAGVPLIWVETAHFKLGSGLHEYALGDDAEEKRRIQGELERLAETLPDVKVRMRKLDPWMRLHLFALRLEDLYGRFLEEFGIQESEFPSIPPDPQALADKPYMGKGRFLGMSAKFTVLLFETSSSLERYSKVFLGCERGSSGSADFPTVGSLLYLVAAEELEGQYDNDSALACAVIGGVAQNLALGFRGHTVPLPFPVSEGLAHWFSRQVDPRYPIFPGLDHAKIRLEDEWNWAPKVRARVEHGVFRPIEQVLAWSEADTLEWSDHVILWSYMDYLLDREDGAAGTLLRRLKEPAGPEALGAEQLAERARRAFPEATGYELAVFDRAWSEWVLATYPKK